MLMSMSFFRSRVFSRSKWEFAAALAVFRCDSANFLYSAAMVIPGNWSVVPLPVTLPLAHFQYVKCGDGHAVARRGDGKLIDVDPSRVFANGRNNRDTWRTAMRGFPKDCAGRKSLDCGCFGGHFWVLGFRIGIIDLRRRRHLGKMIAPSLMQFRMVCN